jgi:hypothetical protein
MEWIYESPLNKKEQDAFKLLKHKLRNKAVAENTVKILSLYVFLKKKNFKTAKQIQNSAFFDKDHKIPIFTKKSAESILSGLKQKGGESNYPFIDWAAKNGISKAQGYLPETVTTPMNNVYALATTPLDTLKDNIPLVDLAIDAVHSSTEIGITTAEDIAEGLGGPIGAAIVTPAIALAAAAASGIAMLENDFGQVIAHVANAVPIMGSSIAKGITKLEEGAKHLEKYPSLAAYVPLVKTYVNQKTGGYRFSSQKRKGSKWLKKTQRKKFAPV